MSRATLSTLASTALIGVVISLNASGNPPTTNAASHPRTGLPPIVVEASRSFKTGEEIASHVTIITAEEIAKKNRGDIVELLRKDAGIYLRSLNSNPSQSQISMRGFGANSHGRVLVTIDGVRLNNPDMSSPNLLRVPLSNIARVEVLHGSQTVLFGDYAEAGVINIVTLSPGERKTTISASGGSYNSCGAGVQHAGAIDAEISYSAGLDWNQSDGYRRNSDFKSWNANGSITKQRGDEREMTLSSFYHKSEFGLPGAINYEQFQYNPKLSTTPDDKSDFEHAGARLYGKANFGDEGVLDATLVFGHRESQTDWASTGGLTDYEVDDYSFSPKYTTLFDIGGHENRLTIGVDSHLNICDGYNHFAGTAMTAPIDRHWKYTRASLAGHMADEFFLTDKLSLLAGVRGESFHNRIKGGEGASTVREEEYACETAALYRPVEDAKLFARASRYYHAPFVDEVIDTYSGIPNTALEPESGYTLETGGSVELIEHVTAALTLYHMNTADEIYYDALTYKNVNAPDDTTRDGVELSLTLADDQIGSIGLIYNYVKARFSDGIYEDNRVPMVPKQTIQLNGELNITDEIHLLATVNHISSQRLENDFANTAPKLLKPSATIDMGLSYQPDYAKGLRLFAGVDNIFDEKHATYGGYFHSQWQGGDNYYYYPANARAWKIAASYSF